MTQRQQETPHTACSGDQTEDYTGQLERTNEALKLRCQELLRSANRQHTRHQALTVQYDDLLAETQGLHWLVEKTYDCMTQNPQKARLLGEYQRLSQRPMKTPRSNLFEPLLRKTSPQHQQQAQLLQQMQEQRQCMIGVEAAQPLDELVCLCTEEYGKEMRVSLQERIVQYRQLCPVTVNTVSGQ